MTIGGSMLTDGMIDLKPQLRKAFGAAREWYKGQQKSTNKQYVVNLDDTKFQRRFDNATTPIKVDTRSGNGAVDIGRRLENLDIWYGNCVEMSCLAAWFLTKAGFRKKLTFCGIDPPGDHVFLTAGEPPKSDRVHRFEQKQRAFMVVDVWMNIRCNSSDYPELVEQKLRKRSGKGQRITSYTQDGKQVIWVPDDDDYIANFLLSDLSGTPCSQII